jgi:hypothetical protein
MPRTVSSISDFGFRISDFRPRSELQGKGTFNGGAWHPDSQRIGVPGILSGSTITEGRFEFRSTAPEAGHGDGHGRGILP